MIKYHDVPEGMPAEMIFLVVTSVSGSGLEVYAQDLIFGLNPQFFIGRWAKLKKLKNELI